MCAYSQVGTAFVADYVPAGAKIAYIFAHPRRDDVVEQRPLSGPWGALMRQLLITDLGQKVEDVAFVHTLRCMPKRLNTRNGPAYDYPSGYLQGAAEGNCRQYDNSSFKDGLLQPKGLISWTPTLFLATLDVDSMLEITAFKYVIQQDLKKAWKFTEEGERVVVLFGSEVLSIVAGHLKGGSKKWRGHWWTTDGWPFEARVRREGFQ